MATINQANLLYISEYVLTAAILAFCTWRHGPLDIMRQIGRRTFLFRLIPVIIMTVAGISVMAGLHMVSMGAAAQLISIGAVQLIMTVFNDTLLAASVFQRYRVYPRGASLAAVLVCLYAVADLFMPWMTKYAVLLAAVAGGILLPEKRGNR